MLKADYYVAPTDLDLLVFEKLIPADHYLRRLKAAINFEPVRALVADCYVEGLGAPAEDPVRLLKLSLLQFQYDLSDSHVLRQAQVNVAFRFFLDLSLDSPLPVPSLLSQFRTRLGAARFEQVFQAILRQARKHGLVKDRLRLKDATHIIANIAIPSTLRLVAQTRERLLAAARSFAPAETAVHQERATSVRQATADLKEEQRLLARVAHLREIVAWADEWKPRLEAAAPTETPLVSQTQLAAFTAALEVAHKVLNDRAPTAHDKLLSLVDPEARTGKHGEYFDGYLLDMSMDADSELICALEVLPANGDEATNAKALIEHEETTYGNDIESLSMDSIGFRGEVLHELSDAESGPHLRVYVPPYQWPGVAPELFKPEEFYLEEQGEVLRCPGGQRTRARRHAARQQGWQFHFRKSHCAQCPLREQCLRPSTQGGRTVIKHDYEAQYQAAKERAQTEDYRQVRQQHPRIERKLADMIRWHGGRRVRYRGRCRVKIQYLLTAIVVNLKRTVKLMGSILHPQPA